MEKIKLTISGMSCDACRSHVEKALNQIEGVKASVNLLTNTASVEMNSENVNIETLITAVEKSGYGATIKGETASDVKTKTEESLKEKKRSIWLSVAFLIPLFYLCMGHMAGFPIPSIFSGHAHMMIFALTQLLLTIAIIFLNLHYFTNGFKNLWHRSPNMDSLIAIGAGASFVYSLYGTYAMAYAMGHGDLETAHSHMMNLYYESCGMILTLVSVGKYMEAKSKGKTNEALKSLLTMVPKTAEVLRDGNLQTLPADAVRVGDIFVIKAGKAVAVDGVIIEGTASLDESALTGESIPRDKTIGDAVMSGSVSVSGYIQCRCTKESKDSTLSEIISMVEEASGSKAPVARLADKISSIFVPIVIGIAMLTFLVWIALGKDFAFAFHMAICVLVISCPCALGLATPTAIMVGMGKGATSGILIKNAEALERAHNTTVVVLDKTGTCTEGKPAFCYISDADDLADLYSLELCSSHPIAKAICAYGEQQNLPKKDVLDFQMQEGGGLSGIIDGRRILIGNERLMQAQGIVHEKFIKDAESHANQGEVSLYYAMDGCVQGILTVYDPVKPDSAWAVSELHSMGLKVHMLTGDGIITAETIGKQLGVEKVYASLLPGDKSRMIQELQQSGEKVCMVGDGINDAPALAIADTAIAIGCGQDIAVESADIILMKNSLADVVNAIALSRATVRNIKENLFWALIYNCLGIPVACGVLYPFFGIRLSPMIGALAMSFSSVFVVTNALRLGKFKIKKSSVHPAEENVKKEVKMMQKKINIEGMMCQHCVKSVTNALNAIEGVSAEVRLEEKCAIVTLQHSVEDAILKKAVEDKDFEVKSIQEI